MMVEGYDEVEEDIRCEEAGETKMFTSIVLK
jgi:hypothetical protein